jgi:hypothetical protein
MSLKTKGKFYLSLLLIILCLICKISSQESIEVESTESINKETPSQEQVQEITNQSEKIEFESSQEPSQESPQEEAPVEPEVPKKKTPEIFDQVRGYRIRNEMELRYLTEISDLTFLVFYYKKDSENSERVAGYLKSIVDKINNVASVIMIDCDTFSDRHFNCREMDGDSFPRLRLLIPPETRYDAQSREIAVHFEYPWTEGPISEISENAIYNYITRNVPDKSTKINSENLFNFLHNDLFNKVILFTDKAEPSLLWRGLTNYFFDKILFGTVFKSQKDIVDEFKVTKFPTLILYKVNDHARLLDEPEIIKYEGIVKTDNLIEWLNPHALKEKRYISQKRGIRDTTAKELASNIVLKTINRGNYEEYLEKYKNKNVVFFFNTKNNPKASIKQFLVQNHGFIISAFFDCDKERKFCLDKFGVTKFPMLKFISKIDGEKGIHNLDDRIKHMKAFNTGKDNKISLDDQMRNFISTKIEEVNNLEFPFKIQEAKQEMKNFIVHFYTSEEIESGNFDHRLISLDLLSNNEEINQFYKFFYVKDPTVETLRMYNVPSLTGLYFFQKMNEDNFKVIQVNRESFYSSLLTVAESLIHFAQSYKGRRKFSSQEVKQITTNAQLQRDCLDMEHCIIAFFDARPGQDNVDKFNSMIEKLEKVKLNSQRYDYVNFNWVNATCHDELTRQFKIDVNTDLPGVVYYSRPKGAYSKFVGLWEPFTLNEHFERCMNNRAAFDDISSENVKIQNLSCEALGAENSETQQTEGAKSSTITDTNASSNQEDIVIKGEKVEL